MKIENKNENIEMNINIKKDKFDNLDIVNYVQDYINKYRCEIKKLEAIFERTNEIDIKKDITAKNEILNILETISYYARANEKQALEEIYQVDDKALDEIFNYCARNIRILEIISNRTSEYSNGVYATCKYIYEIIKLAELEKEGK